jgi:hypothetical protein
LFGYNIFKPKGKRGIVTYKNLSTHQLTAILLALSILPSSIAQEQEAVLPLTEMGGANCTFKADPDEYTALEARVRESVQERAMSFKGGRQNPL